MIEHFNATHFPYKLELIDNRLVLFELMLDNLEGDINLKDVPRRKIFTIEGNTIEDMWKTFINIDYDYNIHKNIGFDIE